jgi:acetolactate synthase-1/2/3 large subunit
VTREQAEEADGGEAVVQACRDAGIDHIFSSPGSEWAPVWEALARQRETGSAGPSYFDLTHETLAVGMAVGYTSVTGKPQLVLLHAGAGLLQGANAVHGALLTGVGVVVCSGESIGYGDAAGRDPGSQWYRNLSIVGGPQAIAASFTKWSSQVGDVAVLHAMLGRARDIAAQSPAGPVYLNTPVEVLLQPWNPSQLVGISRPVAGKTVADPVDVDRLARLLAVATQPVIAVESVGRDAAAWSALIELAELLSIPVVEPQSAVCANFPRTHELHQGGDLERLAATADLVVLLGCRAPWYPPSRKPGNAKVVVVDEVPQRPHMDYQVHTADDYIGGDAALTLRAITERIRSLGIETPSATSRRTALAEQYAIDAAERVAEEQRAVSSETAAIDPIALVTSLREAIGADAVVVDETITHSRTVARHLMADRPGSYHYVQGGLGQGTGVALGVKLARPDDLIVLAIGDGSWLYNPIVQALMASRQYELPLLIIVFNNRSYRSMRHNHERAYPDGVAVRTGRFLGVDLSDQPDPAEVAQACGALGFAVRALEELRPTLDKAVASVANGQTVVVDVSLTR